MENPDSLDNTHAPISQHLLLEIKPQTNKVLDDIAALLECGGIEDELDQKLVAEAVAFIQNPTEDLSDITGHTINIGNVLAGYMTQGADPPPEIDAMNHYLLTLQSINRINFVEGKLLQSAPADSPEIKKAMSRGLDWAKTIYYKTLSKGYNNNTLLTAFHELQARLDNLQNPSPLYKD